jgi:hypothetical protein
MEPQGKKTNTFTKMGVCTPVGQTAPECPAGWTSVGFTDPGSCKIGNTPGDGPTDTWRGFGYKRVCKRTVPTSGDLAADCCGNLFGVAGSVECSAAGWSPYSWKCNTAMSNRCNRNVPKDPYRNNWNGMPYGQGGAVQTPCSGKVRGPATSKQPGSLGAPDCIGCSGCDIKEKGKLDQWCINYLRNAPPNNFFNNHDYTDVGYHFPRNSYTMPQFFGDTWGYQPMRKQYHPYHEWEYKDHNNYCRQFPNECRYTYINDYHF